MTLGEGMTPLLPAPRLGAALGCTSLLVKDEGLNPDGIVQGARPGGGGVARGRAGRARARDPVGGQRRRRDGGLRGARRRAGIRLHAARRADGERHRVRCSTARTSHLVAGLISDCGALVRQGAAARGWFDLSTLREPYRLEGKKTMGYELAEQLGWTLPDAILYPTGGGTGIVGMWKAFDEMERLGWIDGQAPEDDLRAGGGLRAHRARLRARRAARRAVVGRARPSPAACGCPRRSATT